MASACYLELKSANWVRSRNATASTNDSLPNGFRDGWLRSGSLVSCSKLKAPFGSLWTVWARLAAY